MPGLEVWRNGTRLSSTYPTTTAATLSFTPTETGYYELDVVGPINQPNINATYVLRF